MYKQKPCVYPFKYNGTVYDGCTYAGFSYGYSWCSTLVDQNGISKESDYCPPQGCKLSYNGCPEPTLTKNGNCDSVNNIFDCGYDGGDCCPEPNLVNDGNCDDVNNIVGCGYDGGDCYTGDSYVPPLFYQPAVTAIKNLYGKCVKCDYNEWLGSYQPGVTVKQDMK